MQQQALLVKQLSPCWLVYKAGSTHRRLGQCPSLAIASGSSGGPSPNDIVDAVTENTMGSIMSSYIPRYWPRGDCCHREGRNDWGISYSSVRDIQATASRWQSSSSSARTVWQFTKIQF
eukprot:jgi/Botrbrau1/9222/Bobra.0028s0018.1